MNAALKGAPKDTFSAFEPLGTAAYANNDPSGSSSSYYSSTTPSASPDGNGNDDGNDNNDGNGGNRNRGDGNGNDDGNNQGAAFVLPAAGHSVKLRSHSVVG
jgi:hypothetical protein